MSARPVLVLQPRRMGDLILTFPLLMDLQRLFPQSPIWVVARQFFFEPLMPLAPNAVFFSPERLPTLAAHPYEAVINLGGATETAVCAGNARAPLKLGPLFLKDRLHVEGYWQLYRESLTANNRHNAFHWADLFRLDLTPLPLPAIARPRSRRRSTGRIGLFTGASELAKRPEAPFWAALATRLAGMGFKPVLLGGPAEKDLGEAIMAKGARAANFCGRTSIAQLSGLIRTLDLLITPDTGPMHLADWLATPVLNLSMGPVHALETGPLSPGQHVLRAAMSCAGCWQCLRGKLHCRSAFAAPAVARMAAAIIRGEKDSLQTAGLEILTSRRNDLRLYSLDGRHPGASLLLDNFWQAAFLYFSDQKHENRLLAAAGALAESQPALAASFRKRLARVASAISASGRNPLDENFWRLQPWHTRIFAGHTQMALQNAGYAPGARATALERAKALDEALGAKL